MLMGHFRHFRAKDPGLPKMSWHWTSFPNNFLCFLSLASNTSTSAVPDSEQGGTYSSLISKAEPLSFAGKTTSLPLLVKLFCSASNEYSLDRRGESGRGQGWGCSRQGALNLCSSINSWSNQDNREAVCSLQLGESLFQAVEKLHSQADKARLSFPLDPARLKQLHVPRLAGIWAV